MATKYNRVLLKLSGESLGKDSNGLSHIALQKFAAEVGKLVKMGVEVGIVVGGGNFFRGRQAKEIGIERTQGDAIGMLATVINGIAFQNALDQHGVASRHMSSIHIREVCEPFAQKRALRHLEKKRVVIFSAGTGNPYFTTDTAATLRAAQIGAQVLLKGTNVDGVYDADPRLDKEAKIFKEVQTAYAIANSLAVMDKTAFALSEEMNIDIIVFNINREDELV